MNSILKKSASDIVVLAAQRTPITKAIKGGLAKLYPEELLQQIIEGTIQKSGVNKALIDDVLVGTVCQTLGGQKASALAVKSLGFPVKTTINTVNRQCASSAQAISYSASTLASGENMFTIAAGVESMTHDYFFLMPNPWHWNYHAVDDGIRGKSTYDKLASLKPVFAENGTTTAGNSSQISDGASCMILTTRGSAEKFGYKPIARFVGSSVAGVPSAYMGIGPAVSIPQLLARFNLSTRDIGIFELNEAFASQSLYCIRELGLEMKRVNPYGGAIALGHPLGATGARLGATLINGLHAQTMNPPNEV
ncbi:hypothetical protein JCM33374_g1752 [Metschnikowia sp. JCM 33374]|nr:hypothetical protein JCM33374_g1752 [Metschnikowia sp. JCM 33374]